MRMDDIPLSKLRKKLGAYGTHIGVTGKRVVVTSHGGALFALVSVDDLKRLERADEETEARIQANYIRQMRELEQMRKGRR